MEELETKRKMVNRWVAFFSEIPPDRFDTLLMDETQASEAESIKTLLGMAIFKSHVDSGWVPSGEPPFGTSPDRFNKKPWVGLITVAPLG